MARTESKAIMGYHLPIEAHHHSAILSLIAPATLLFDPFAGEGVFLETAARAWNVTPYANELDGDYGRFWSRGLSCCRWNPSRGSSPYVTMRLIQSIGTA